MDTMQRCHPGHQLPFEFNNLTEPVPLSTFPSIYSVSIQEEANGGHRQAALASQLMHQLEHQLGHQLNHQVAGNQRKFGLIWAVPSSGRHWNIKKDKNNPAIDPIPASIRLLITISKRVRC